jgi:hypothetical protein
MSGLDCALGIFAHYRIPFCHVRDTCLERWNLMAMEALTKVRSHATRPNAVQAKPVDVVQTPFAVYPVLW